MCVVLCCVGVKERERERERGRVQVGEFSVAKLDVQNQVDCERKRLREICV